MVLTPKFTLCAKGAAGACEHAPLTSLLYFLCVAFLFTLYVVPNNETVNNCTFGVMESKGQASKIFNCSFNLKLRITLFETKEITHSVLLWQEAKRLLIPSVLSACLSPAN